MKKTNFFTTILTGFLVMFTIVLFGQIDTQLVNNSIDLGVNAVRLVTGSPNVIPGVPDSFLISAITTLFWGIVRLFERPKLKRDLERKYKQQLETQLEYQKRMLITNNK